MTDKEPTGKIRHIFGLERLRSRLPRSLSEAGGAHLG